MTDYLAIAFFWTVWRSTRLLIWIGHAFTGNDD
jgi:hypothetical protein